MMAVWLWCGGAVHACVCATSACKDVLVAALMTLRLVVVAASAVGQ